VNRITLLTILLGAPLLPLCRFETGHLVPKNLKPGTHLQEEIRERLSAPALTVIIGPHTAQQQSDTPAPQRSFSLLSIALLPYFGLTAGLALWYAASIGRLLRFLHYHCQQRKIRCIRLAVYEEDLTPFSFGRTICLSRNENRKGLHFALLHEAGHISLFHAFDLLLLHLLSLANPLVLLLLADLKKIHEFEADRFVERRSKAPKQYQYFLLNKSTGVDAYALVHHFNTHFIKQRITMMNRKRTSRSGLLRLAVFLPALCILAASHAMTNTEPSSKDVQTASIFARKSSKFSLKGTWILTQVIFSKPPKTIPISGGYTRIKIYKENGAYHCAQIFRNENRKLCVSPNETGAYSLTDKEEYVECSRKTPFKILGPNEMTTEWDGMTEFYKRLTDWTPDGTETTGISAFPTEQIKETLSQYNLGF